MAHRCNVFYFSDSSKWPPVALMTALQTLLSHSTSIPSQLQCAEVRLQHSWQSYLTTVQIHDESGLCGQIAAKTLLLEKSNKQKKFVLAKKHKKWTLDQWTSALWSGESKIEIFALWGCFSWPKSNQYGQAWDGTKQRAILKNQRVSSLFFPICAISYFSYFSYNLQQGSLTSDWGAEMILLCVPILGSGLREKRSWLFWMIQGKAWKRL